MTDRIPGAPARDRPGPAVTAAEAVSIGLVVCLHLALAAVFVAATPPLEASDEAGHFGYLVDWAATGHLPAATAQERGHVAQETTQPPLYYALGRAAIVGLSLEDVDSYYRWRPGAPTGRADLPGPRNMLEPVPVDAAWAQTGAAIRRVRWLSVFLSLAAVLLTWRLARLAGGDVPTGVFAACLVAFNPMFLFIGSSVNNDALVIPLTALVMLAALRSTGAPPGLRWGFGLGLLTGLAILAKVSAIVVVPPLLVLLATRVRPRESARALAGIGLGIAATTGWWLARMFAVYGTIDPASIAAEILGNRRLEPAWRALVWEWSGFFKSFWGVFGGFNVIYPAWIYGLFLVLTLTLSASVLVMLAGRRPHWREQAFLIAVVMTNLLAVAWWTRSLRGSQGRLMFPSMAAIAALSALSVQTWPSVPRHAFRALVVAGLLAAAAYAGLDLIPSGYDWP